jgi:hypothetical protein
LGAAGTGRSCWLGSWKVTRWPSCDDDDGDDESYYGDDGDSDDNGVDDNCVDDDDDDNIYSAGYVINVSYQQSLKSQTCHSISANSEQYLASLLSDRSPSLPAD